MNVHKSASIIHVQLGTGCDFWETQHTVPISVYLLNIKTIKMTELCTLDVQSQQLLTDRAETESINLTDITASDWPFRCPGVPSVRTVANGVMPRKIKIL